MKIIGITRVRNEENIISNTLDHVSKLVDGIIVVDDASTDYTPWICHHHPKVLRVIQNKYWDETPAGRNQAEGDLRDLAYREALRENPDWIYYFDADEYAYFDDIKFDADAYKLRLFDFYITPDDRDKHYLERKLIGPEYRDILMLFRADPKIRFFQREPNIPDYFRTENGGCVKHYGKAISIDEWEKTCEYYINYRGADYLPQFRDKWLARRGKAIHTKSDFGAELINWDDRNKYGFPLID